MIGMNINTQRHGPALRHIDDCKRMLPAGVAPVDLGPLAEDGGFACTVLASPTAVRAMVQSAMLRRPQAVASDLIQQLSDIRNVSGDEPDVASFTIERDLDDGTLQELWVHQNLRASPPFVFLMEPEPAPGDPN